MTFKKWIERYKGEDSPLGDLCADIRRDSEFPKGNVSHDTILTHLHSHGACYECIATFEEAWTAYSKENGGTTSTV